MSPLECIKELRLEEQRFVRTGSGLVRTTYAAPLELRDSIGGLVRKALKFWA